MKNTKSLSARRIAKLMGLPESVSIVTELTEEAITEGVYEPEVIHASTSILIAGVARKVQETSFWKAGKVSRPNIYSAVVEITKHNPMVNQKLGGPTKFATLFAEAAMKSIKEDQPKKVSSEDLKGDMFDDGGVEMDKDGKAKLLRKGKSPVEINSRGTNSDLYDVSKKIALRVRKDDKDVFDDTFNEDDSQPDLRPIMTDPDNTRKNIIGVFPDGEDDPAEAYEVSPEEYKSFTKRVDSKMVASRDNSARRSKRVNEGAFSEMDIDNQDGAIEGFCILMDWEITPQDITNVETLEEGLYEITVGDVWYVYDANADCITDQGNVTSPEEAMMIEGSKARNRARRIKEARARIAEKKALKEASNKKRYSKYSRC